MRCLGYEEIVREGNIQVGQIREKECRVLPIDGTRPKAGPTRAKDIFEVQGSCTFGVRGCTAWILGKRARRSFTSIILRLEFM